MGQGTKESSDDRSTARVSDALRQESTSGSPVEWLRRAELWLFVDAHRWVVIALLTGLVFAAVTLAVTIAPPTAREYLLGGTALAKGYVELQTIDVTVITIVLTINQLVLSTEVGSLGQQRSRLDDILENRTNAEDISDAPSTPTAPRHYLRTLTETTREQAERLRETVADSDDPELRRRVERYVDGVLEETDDVARQLDDHRFGTIEMLGAAMHFTTADEIHAVRDIHGRHAESLSEAEQEAFEDMLEVLQLYTVAREYFRALYVKWEFINFSRAILYVGLPALVIAHLSIGFIDSNAFPGTLFGFPNLFWYETLAFTVILVPVLVVISYAARLSMLAKASIFISPFSPEQKGGHWEE